VPAPNTGIYNWTIPQSINDCDRNIIKVTPENCNVFNLNTHTGYFTIASSSPTIPSYNMSIVIWTIIWITIPVIIFLKKKYKL